MFEEFNLSNLENKPQELEELLENNKKTIKTLLELKHKTYKNFVEPYQSLQEKLEQFYTPISHIDSVKNSDLTQEVYGKTLPLLSVYSSWVSSNEDIYDTFKEIYQNEKDSLNKEQKKVVENELKDFKLGGCGLSDDDKQTLEDINLKLSELSKEFSQNLLDATNNWEMILEDYEDIKEIPKSDLEVAKFEKDGKELYKFTLQMPSYIAYITYGTNRAKREEIYKAYTTRAPENGKLIEKILELKQQKAKLLGFENFAQLSLETKMAQNEDKVLEFLYELAQYTKDKSKEELKEVQQLAKKDGCDDIQSYDLAYYSEKLKKQQYDIDEEFYRVYFEKNSVVDGLFLFLDKLFGIKFKQTTASTWDSKVLVYDLYENGKTIARLYLDLEAREDKRGGAWMHNWHTHSVVDGTETLATAFVVANFPISKDDTPSLLRHSDVVTLFHEMGHALHHLLSKVDEPFVSGINGVAWDTVEFPSQFLEYFAYEKDVLKLFAKHYKTGEILDDTSIDKLIKAKNFQSSLATVRQLEFALFDFKLHQKLYDEEGVQTLLDNIRKDVSALVPPSYNKFQNGFAHIFSGGYSAGYYSYKWAEVLSADAFSLFVENGIFDKNLAKKYKDIILSCGGSEDMNILYHKFAQKEPDVKSLLKIDGIIK